MAERLKPTIPDLEVGGGGGGGGGGGKPGVENNPVRGG